MAQEVKPHAVPQDISIKNSIAQPMEEETSGPLSPENTKTADDAGNDKAKPMETDEDSDNGVSEPMEEEASNYAQEREKEGTDEATSNDMPPPMAGRTLEPIVAGDSENAGETENTETTESANQAQPTPMTQLFPTTVL